MSEHERFLADNPSVDLQLGRIAGTLGEFMRQQREVNRRTDRKLDDLIEAQKETDRKVTVQNGNVATAIRENAALQERINAHDDHHGDDDEAIILRLQRHDDYIGELRQERHDSDVRRGVFVGSWKVLAGAVFFGAALASIVGVLVQVVLRVT